MWCLWILLFNEVVKLTNRELSKLHTHNGHSVEVYESQIKENQKKLSKLYGALETGKLEIDELAPRIRTLKESIDELQEKRQSAIRLHDSKKVLELSTDQIRDCVLSLREVLDNSPIQRQKAFIQSFIKKVTIEGSMAHIEYTFPLDDLIPEDQRELVLAMEGNGVADGT